VECVRQLNEVAIILGIISLSSFFLPAFCIKSQKGMSLGSEILHGLLIYKNTSISTPTFFWFNPPCAPWGRFFYVFISLKKNI
jgi:hypothetical protein